jgi:hypothetical protein
MSGLSQKRKWLSHTKAAEALGVNVRTIERWMKCPMTHNALGAVQNGKKWRIPHPDNREHWRTETCWRLKKLGINLPEDWERNFSKIAQENSRHWLESNRLWLAGYATVLERGRITQEAREAILLLRQVAAEILRPLPRYEMQVGRFKDQFVAKLLTHHLDKVFVAVRCCPAASPSVFALVVAALLDVRTIMGYWPKGTHLKQVRLVHTLGELEKIRRDLDYRQAVRDLEHLGKKPTHANIGPLLHMDMMAHINDTRDRIPGTVVKNPKQEVVRFITLKSVSDRIAGKKPPLVTLDFQQPQKGLKRRAVQKRHPQKQRAQRTIVADVYGINATTPSVDWQPDTGKTPIQKPIYDAPITAQMRSKRM